jgi:hypothetical protein
MMMFSGLNILYLTGSSAYHLFGPEIGRAVDVDPVAALHPGVRDMEKVGYLRMVSSHFRREVEFLEVFVPEPLPDDLPVLVHLDEMVVHEDLVGDLGVLDELVAQDENLSLVVVHFEPRGMIPSGAAFELVVVVVSRAGQMPHRLAVPVHDDEIRGMRVTPDAPLLLGGRPSRTGQVASLEQLGRMLSWQMSFHCLTTLPFMSTRTCLRLRLPCRTGCSRTSISLV